MAFIENLYAAGLSWTKLSKDEALAYIKKLDLEFQAVSVSVFGVLFFTSKKYNESYDIKTNSATHFVEYLRKHIYHL